ncbi:hypothetical protein CLAIMM_03688 [Cladophialophora immunda]|nr:hypothetical protein CLAIMM_03688 [Cladophialophora immunda]
MAVPSYLLLPLFALACVYLLVNNGLFCRSQTQARGPSSLSADSPALQQFHAWLEAFNTLDRDTLAAYHADHFPYDVASDDVANIDREVGLSRHTGGFLFVQAETPCESEDGDRNGMMRILLREKKRPQYARVAIQVNSTQADHPVTKFEIGPTTTPVRYAPEERKKEYEKALAPLTQEMKRKIVAELCEVVREQYVFPETGDKIISQLQANEIGGDYRGYMDSEDWAKRLTKDMVAVSNDKHIRALKDINFGFGAPLIEAVGGKKIGIIRIDGFVPLMSMSRKRADDPKIHKAIGDIISHVADTDALLMDLRKNGGGVPETVAYILSYFLDDGPVHLTNFVDRDGVVRESFSTLPASELPSDTDRFGGSKPLFVLTSEHTASGGEEMAYNLQALQRATAIVGTHNTTAGAANPVMRMSSICDEDFGPGWWRVGIPDMQPMNAITKGNWEGVGVKSDVVVERDQDPVDVATRLALKALEAVVEVTVQAN